MNDYAKQKLHPRWQRRRLEIMQRAKFACESCGDKENTLDIDHRIYRTGRKLWEYEDHELWCLCRPCHVAVTAARQRVKEAILSLGIGQICQVAGYARGLEVSRRVLVGEQLSLDPGFLFDADDWEGVAHALGLSLLDSLCSGDTTEADLGAALKARLAELRRK